MCALVCIGACIGLYLSLYRSVFDCIGLVLVNTNTIHTNTDWNVLNTYLLALNTCWHVFNTYHQYIPQYMPIHCTATYTYWHVLSCNTCQYLHVAITDDSVAGWNFLRCTIFQLQPDALVVEYFCDLAPAEAGAAVTSTTAATRNAKAAAAAVAFSASTAGSAAANKRCLVPHKCHHHNKLS